MAQFARRTEELIKFALGEEFLVPSLFVVGEKNDSERRYKVFTVQPQIVGPTTKKASPSQIEAVRDQWNILGPRLSILYNAASCINSSLPPEEVFPITITVGNSRSEFTNGNNDYHVPKTGNLLIEEETGRLFLCDFGEYIPWQDDMSRAYDQIVDMIGRIREF